MNLLSPSKPTRESFLLSDLKTVLQLVDEERHIFAYDLYAQTSTSLKSLPQNGSNKSRKQIKEIEEFLVFNKAAFSKLARQAAKFHECKEALKLNESWTVAQTLFGITTSYRRETDGSLSLKLEGELNDVPLFEQLAVIREIDLFHKWAPFVKAAKRLCKITKIEMVGWFIVSVPLLGLARDAVYHASGCDCLREDGTFIITAASIDSESTLYPNLSIPNEPTGWGSARMEIRSFSCLIEVLSPTSARTKIIANVNPKLLLPQKLIDFCMRKLCGVLLLCMQSCARSVVKDPECDHAKRMREDRSFYSLWLLPKFKTYCDIKGWTLPEISAFSSGYDVDFDEKNRRSSMSPTKRKNPLLRGAHKIHKRANEISHKNKYKEYNSIVAQGEADFLASAPLKLFPPSLKERYSGWSAKLKQVNGAASGGVFKSGIGVMDRFVELPIWVFLLFVVLKESFNRISSLLDRDSLLSNILNEDKLVILSFIFNLCSIFYITFTSSMDAKTRRLGTLNSTRSFGTLMVFLVSLLLTGCCYFSVKVYTSFESTMSLSDSMDNLTWDDVELRRVKLLMLRVSGLCCVVSTVVAFMIRHSEPSKVEASSVNFGHYTTESLEVLSNFGGLWNKKAKSKEDAEVEVSSEMKGGGDTGAETSQERRDRLAEKLRERRKGKTVEERLAGGVQGLM